MMQHLLLCVQSWRTGNNPSVLRRSVSPNTSTKVKQSPGTHTRSTRISFSLCLTLRMMLSNPMPASLLHQAR